MSRRERVSIVLAAAMTLLSFASAIAQPAASDKVMEIRVRGNVQMTRDAVLVNVRARVGEVFDEQVVARDQERLLRTGRFESVRATAARTPEGVILTFEVIERPVVADVQFAGNKSFKAADLMKELPFGAGDPLSEFDVESGRLAIENAYRAKGYFYAKVTADKSALKQRKVVYRIVEGPKVSVRKIKFEGNEFFGGFRLRMAVGSSARFWPFTAGKLDAELIERDVSMLRGMYVAEGFLDVEVDRDIQFTPDKKRVTVTFLIDEGPRYRVDRIIFRGNTVFADAELAGRLKLRQSRFFTSAAVSRDLRVLEDTYGELGYIDATVQVKKRYVDPTAPLPLWATSVKEPKPALVNVVFDIKERDQYRFGRIEVRGNTVTQTRVIRRELRFFPEQLFNTVAVRESRKRLLETRLFDEVSVTRAGKTPGLRDVVVQVREGQTAQFLIAAGASSNEGIVGRISFTQRNFDIARWPRTKEDILKGTAWKGAGQTLRIVAEPGLELMRFRIEWFEPAMFDKPYSLGTKAFYFARAREKHDESRYGGAVSVGHRFKNRWYGEIAPRIENVEISSIDANAPKEVKDTRGTNALLGLKGTLVRDRTDSRWRPTTGDRFRISYEQVTGDWGFGKVTGDYRMYRTLYVDALDRKHVLSARVNAGGILGTAPVFERFYGGGIGSIRGFAYRGVSPRGKGSKDQIGGDFSLFAGAEYEFPLVGQQLCGVIFVDTGTVEEDFEITTYRASVGIGLRWIIGAVPMNLDLAFPISKSGDDDTQPLSFSLGITF